MLRQSYAAVQQFQSQISSVQTIRELKNLSSSLGLSLSFRVTSSCFWILDWDLTNRKFSGTMELSLLPILSLGLDKFEASHARTLRIEDPKQFDQLFLEQHFLDLMKQSISSISKSDRSKRRSKNTKKETTQNEK